MHVLEPVIDVHLFDSDITTALAADAGRLAVRPRSLPPKWLYDDRGSALFDEITRLNAYYPTRCERSILERRSAEIVEASGADTLVELGSGTTDKTRCLLDAFTANGQLERFVPFDVSEATLRSSADAISNRYPSLQVHGVVGDFERHLDRLPGGGRRMVAFLGSTIGNLIPEERHRFLTSVAATLATGDSLLVGTDLVKDVGRLLAAYDDPEGVTALFNLNMLRVLNRELGANFDDRMFRHEARWNAAEEWIEMHLVATRAHSVRIASIGLELEFEQGESIRTEVSAKFRRSGVVRELQAAGFSLTRFWTDDAGDFALSLATRR